MNYKEHYDRLIKRAKNRQLDCYSENHHIIPRCLGGDNSKLNMARLTAREHFVAHILLVKIYPKSYGLIRAVNMMCHSSSNQDRIGNRMYGWLREKYSKELSRHQSGKNNSQYGTIWIYSLEEKISKKIKKEELSKFEKLGWIKGYKLKFLSDEEIKEKELLKQKKINEKKLMKENRIKELNILHKIYKENGWKKFVEITNYKFTKQNLVISFSKYVNDFVPQNGKKR